MNFLIARIFGTFCCVSVVVAWNCSISSSDSRRVPLTVGVLLPNQYRQMLEPAMNLALDHIHNHSCVIADYYLDLRFKNTECNTSFGMKALFELMNERPRVFALFGDVCTNVNEPVAMASKYWHIIHLSYAETHAKFSTADAKEMYPTFFRMVPGYRNSNLARCHLMRQFNWKRVGTIKQSDDPRFALPHEALTTQLEHKFNVTVVYTAGITHDEIGDIGNQLDELKNRDARILIGDFEESLAVRIMCEAYQRGIYGQKYAWILPGYHKKFWWRNVAEVNCTIDEMTEVVNAHFAVQFSTHSIQTDQLTIANKTSAAIVKQLGDGYGWDVCDWQRSCNELMFRGYVYDGLWTLSLAIDRIAQRYRSQTGKLWDPGQTGHDGIEVWNSSSPDDALLQQIAKTSFIGVTGRVQFENNERLGLVEILQWHNDSYIPVAIYDGTASMLSFRSAAPDWTVPLDSTVVIRQKQYIAFVLIILLGMLAAVGILLALVFLIVNVKHRKHRLIKMSSPNINNIIIAGSICTYLSVILRCVDTRLVSDDTFVALCYAKTWSLSLGFTLAFGSMFSKTWRVHLIFKNIRMNKRAIKDYKLYILVGIMVLIDLIILALWANISPFSLVAKNLATYYTDNEMIEPVIERCLSSNSIVFEAITLGIKGLLMMLGCFLAWETRHVSVPALNDSKYIGMSVYSVVVVCLLGLPLVYILQDQMNEAHVLGSFFIIFCTTLTLCLVFVPKVIELARNPRGTEKSYRRGLMKSLYGKQLKFMPQTVITAKISDKDLLQQMEKENIMLHHFLSEKSHILLELKKQLRKLGQPIEDDDSDDDFSDNNDEPIKKEGDLQWQPVRTNSVKDSSNQLYSTDNNNFRSIPLD